MNEELQERLMGYLENVEKAVEGGTDFVMQQAPFYVQELIKWEIAWNAIWAVFWLGIVVALPLCFGKLIKKLREIPREDPMVWGWILTILMGIIMFSSTVASLGLAGQSLKAYIAPRVVIMEKLSGLNK